MLEKPSPLVYHAAMLTPSDLEARLEFPCRQPPAPGELLEMAPGVFWLRMPLPTSLDHINLYLLEDEGGWVCVDTGIRGQETREIWAQMAKTSLGGKPITRIICTHMHPDHTGQAGFLSECYKAPLLMSYAEYYQAKTMFSMSGGSHWHSEQYFLRAGLAPDILEQMRQSRSSYFPESDDQAFPGSFERLSHGDSLQIGKNTWQILTGSGHSPEHVCLYSPELRLLLSGDQVLPIITSNVSVHPTEPEANPMLGWLASHVRFREDVSDEVLVLPAHNLPFYGLHERLQQLIDHHEDRMLALEESCVEPRAAMELLPILFRRKLEGASAFMATGECIAHLHCLMSRGRIRRTLAGEVYHYQSIDPGLGKRSRPGDHLAPDERPLEV